MGPLKFREWTEAGGIRQDNVYDVDVKVLLLPNVLDVDILMALPSGTNYRGSEKSLVVFPSLYKYTRRTPETVKPYAKY